MATLLLAEVAGGQLNDATARALTAALELGQPVDVLVAGQNVGARRRGGGQASGRGEGRWSRTILSMRMASPSRWRR